MLSRVIRWSGRSLGSSCSSSAGRKESRPRAAPGPTHSVWVDPRRIGVDLTAYPSAHSAIGAGKTSSTRPGELHESPVGWFIGLLHLTHLGHDTQTTTDDGATRVEAATTRRRLSRRRGRSPRLQSPWARANRVDARVVDRLTEAGPADQRL